jgi:mannose-1-phosphate guanylyltransferase
VKAFLLAAGKGTRLQPITFETPKCLIPVNGRPLIEYWFDLFDMYGIDDILINTSHLADKVKDYISENSREIRIRLTFEESLLGSGGTIKKNWDFIREEGLFFVFYADNLTDINLEAMLEFHNDTGKDFTMALSRVLNPGECGIVELDDDYTVTSFTEKPEEPSSDLAFAGMMLCSTALIDIFPDREIFDLGYDVLPLMVGKTSGYIMKDYLLDIGTIEKLRQAEEDIRKNRLNVGIDIRKKI